MVAAASIDVGHPSLLVIRQFSPPLLKAIHALPPLSRPCFAQRRQQKRVPLASSRSTLYIQAFEPLKVVFSSAPALRHWDPLHPTRVKADASNKAISRALSQLVDLQWRPIAYWSRKLTDAELRWATEQQELLAIVESLNTGAIT